MAAAKEIEIIFRGRDEASAAAEKVKVSLSGLAKAAQGGLGGLGAFIAGAAGGAAFAAVNAGLQAIGSAFSSIGDAVIGFNANMEQAQMAFTTLLKSGGQAKAFLDDLAQFAARTPFNFPELVQSARRMMALGFSAKEIKPLLTSIGDAAAAMGTGNEGVMRITVALGQMKTRGRVASEEMMQLTEAGIPAWDALSKAIGKTTAETQKMVTKGQVGASTMIKAFQDYATANFGGMMEKQAQTFSGAMTTIQDSVQMAAATAFRPIFDVISQLAVRIAQFVSSDQFSGWALQIQAKLQTVIRAVGIFANTFFTILGHLVRIAQQSGRLIGLALDRINPFARHSPSLVENVEKGVAKIIQEYSKLGRAVPPQFLALARQQYALNQSINQQERAITQAERALRPWQAQLEKAQARVAEVREKLQAARDALNYWANAPLKGTRAFDDALFANDQAAKKIQLRLLNIQLGPKFPGAKREVFELEKQLGRLRLEGEKTQLEKSLTLDPLRRQLEQLADDSEEVTFEQARDGIIKAKQEIAKWEPELVKAEDAVKRIQKIIEAKQAAIQAMRDRLEDTRLAYQDISDAVQDWSDKLQEAISAAKAGMGGTIEADTKLNNDNAVKSWADFKRNVEGDLTGLDAAMGRVADQLNLDKVEAELNEKFIKPAALADQAVTAAVQSLQALNYANATGAQGGPSGGLSNLDRIAQEALNAKAQAEIAKNSTAEAAGSIMATYTNVALGGRLTADQLQEISTTTGLVLKAMSDDGIGFFQRLFDEIVGHSIVPDMAREISDTWQTLQDDSEEQWEAIRRAITRKINDTRDVVVSALSTMSYWAGYYGGKIDDALTTAFENVDAAADTAVVALRDNFPAALRTLGQAITAPDGILSKIQQLIDKLNAIPTEITIHINYDDGGGPPNAYAHGGYVPETGLALIHRGEYVVPSSQVNPRTRLPAWTPRLAPAAASAGGGLVVNGPLIGRASIRSERDITALAYEISRIQTRRRR